MIFLSYSRNDGVKFVADLERRLQAHQKLAWRDVRDLHSDQDFTGDIEEAIENSSHVVVCITPDTKRKNSFVRREIQYALALQKPVIPYRCADIPPHVSIVNNEWIDYFTNPDAAFKRLLTIIDGEAYENRPSDAPEDPFKPYLESAFKFIVEALHQRIIVPIDLKTADMPEMVKAPRLSTSKRSVFELAMSGVKLGADEKEPEAHHFSTFSEGFERYGGRVLLLGEPGAGKTVTLMAYARDAYAARLDDPAQPLPLFNLVPTWDGSALDLWIAQAHDLNIAAVRREMEAGRALLLLDGLDELGKGDEQADPRLLFLQALPANNRILLTSRIQEYSEISQKAALNGAIMLQSLDDNQMREYLQRQPELFALLETDEQLRDLTRTPLLMSLFAFAYQDLPEDERHQLTELTNAHELREKIFMRYIEQRYTHERTKIGAELPFTLADVKRVLSRLAMENSIGNFYRDAAGKLYTPRENVLANVDLRRVLPDDLSASFAELAVGLNLLARNDDETYRFIHLLLRDTLAHHSLLQALVNPDKAVRRHAADTLGRVGDARAALPLSNLLRDSNQIVRSRAADALVMIGEPSIEPLIAAVSDLNADTRRLAISALGKIGDPRAVEPLIAAISDSNTDVRNQAANALGKIGDPRAIGALVTCLGESGASALRSVTFIIESFGEAAVDALANALMDSNARIRERAVEILGKIGSAQAIDALITAMSDPDANIRRAAAYAAGQTRNPRTIEPLIAALDDSDWDVSRTAAGSLGHMVSPEAKRAAQQWQDNQKRR